MANRINVSLLRGGAAKLGVNVGENEVVVYQKYLDILLEWNSKVNLTAIKEPDEIVVKHFLDSIAVLPHLPAEGSISMLDVGTGAGFPGVPIKIAENRVNVVLLDSLKKRVSFLQHLITELSLDNITIVHGRAEDLGHVDKFRDRFDVVISRAVAKLSVLAELCLPFVKVGGFFIAYKGPKAQEEIWEAGNSLEVLGGKVGKLLRIVLPGDVDERVLVFVEKLRVTPDRYPRKAGVPEKRPL